MHQPHQLKTITRLRDGRAQPHHDALAVEAPMEIRVDAQPLAVTMRTPGHDLELAAGFCLTESIVRDPDDLEAVRYCDQAEHGNVVLVELAEAARQTAACAIREAQRAIYLSSSCGLCGKQSIDRVRQNLCRPIDGRFTVGPDVLEALPTRMRKRQATFEQTGGLHAAALFSPEGELRLLREDVGRHNAVDKLVGAALFSHQLPLDPGVLLVSGRASFEIMQKAALAGIAVVAAVSAPSTLAVEFAVETNMTLVGFLRPGRMNIYHDVGRISRP